MNEAVTLLMAQLLNRDYAEAYYGRGWIYGNEGRYDRAIGDYTKVIQFKSDFACAWCMRGFSYRKQGQLNKAVADLTEAIRVKADMCNAYLEAARLFKRLAITTRLSRMRQLLFA